MIRLFILLTSSLLLAQNQQIRDPQGRLLGTIVCDKRKCEARDPQWRLRGIYLIRQNETRDPMYRLIARGNVLASTLRK